MASDWIPRSDAAARARVHRNTVLLWERRGLLRTKRVSGPSGQLVHVNVADLDSIISKRPNRPRGGEDRVAILEAELAACRERLEAVDAERSKLLAEVLSIARGRRRT
jgi:hypothetical protein